MVEDVNQRGGHGHVKSTDDGYRPTAPSSSGGISDEQLRAAERVLESHVHRILAKPHIELLTQRTGSEPSEI
jgi:hypothetical protein